MITIPGPTKNFSQANRSTTGSSNLYGQFVGNILGTFNMDLYSNKGKMRVSGRGLLTSNPNGGGVPVVFIPFLNVSSTKVWYTVAGSKVFLSSSLNPSSAFSVDGQAGSPTTCDSLYSDAAIFNGKLYVTTNTANIYGWNGSAWSNFAASLNINTPHMLCLYNNRMYVSDLYSKIYSFDSSETMATSGQNTIVTSSNSLANVITCMRVAQNRIVICTVNTQGGRGHVYVWDGVSNTTFDQTIELDSVGALSCVIKDDIPYITDARGFLLKYNGANFTEIDRLPIPSGKTLLNSMDIGNDRWIHPNGMTVCRGNVTLLINNQLSDSVSINAYSTGNISEFCPSGWWEEDPEIGLYHRGSVTYTPSNGTTITDYGQIRIEQAGAILDATVDWQGNSWNGNLLMGAKYFTNGTSGDNFGIFTNDLTNTTQKWGYIIFPEIYAQEIESLWGMVTVRYRKFLDSADLILLKYRTVIDTPQEFLITWTSTSTLTTTGTTTYLVGDEIEITKGPGAGKSAKITNINGSTITLGDTFTGVTGTAMARFSKWQEINKITYDAAMKQYSKASLPPGGNDTKISLKVCMQFLGNGEFEELLAQETTEVALTN